MARALKTAACRSCGSAMVAPHCESPTCTWERCRDCHSWGEDRGYRWVDARKKEA